MKTSNSLQGIVFARHKKIGVIITLSMQFICLSMATHAKSMKPESVIQDGLQMTVTSSKGSVFKNEPILFKVTLLNKTTENIVLYDAAHIENWVHGIRLGDYSIESKNSRERIGNASLELAPDQPYIFQVQYDPKKHLLIGKKGATVDADELTPGQYPVTLTYSPAQNRVAGSEKHKYWEGRIMSHPLEISIENKK